jgi:hypothetical protein
MEPERLFDDTNEDQIAQDDVGCDVMSARQMIQPTMFLFY